MKKKLTRRQFLALLSTGAAGAAWLKSGLAGVKGAGNAGDIYLPLVSKPQPTATVPPPTNNHRVVRVHHSSVTNWNQSGDYWSHVDQAKTTAMVENGVKTLTGKNTVAEAWRALLPNYTAGQKIAIKVNFNNTIQGCSNTNIINALPQVVIPVIAGLISIGVAQQNIGIYDGLNRSIPPYFHDPVHAMYSQVMFYDTCHTYVGTSTNTITFSPPSGSIAAQHIAKVAEDAAYLINIPIVKNHAGAGVTLGFKNHFGTIFNPSDLHFRTFVSDEGSQYRTDYNPLVDIYKSPMIGPKTVLTIGDAIYGALGSQDVAPTTWPNTFGDYPKSLFFAIDPVAIDSVMADFLDAEYGNLVNSTRYLELAEAAGLGMYDHVDNPLANPAYTRLDYRLVNL